MYNDSVNGCMYDDLVKDCISDDLVKGYLFILFILLIHYIMHKQFEL